MRFAIAESTTFASTVPDGLNGTSSGSPVSFSQWAQSDRAPIRSSPRNVSRWFLGIQIPVDDALLVGGGETCGDLPGIVHGLLLRDQTRGELPAQRLALEKLHDGVGEAVVVPEVVDGKYGRMLTPCSQFPKERGRRGSGIAASARIGMPRCLMVACFERGRALPSQLR